AVFSAGAAIAETINDRIGQWTGKHTRLVWLQDQGNGADALAHGKNLMLYGYDSRDGRGERPLLPKADNWFTPLITPDGSQVIVSNRAKRQMFLVEWESGKVRELGEGVAVAVWQDPKPSLLLRRTTTWVYCLSGTQPENKYGSAQPLYRFALDNPKKKELLWNKTNLAWSNIQLSRDGELMGGLFPWPDGGVLWTKDKRFQRLGKGCWTSLSPDNSKLLWIFDGLHRNLQIHDVPGGKSWNVKINGAPGIGGYEVYHPRWSNHPRYFVLTGPYVKGEGGNKIGGGGEKVEIYIGRFDERAQKVEEWLKVTANGRADFFPDLWIEGGNEATLTGSVAEVSGPVETVWPASRDHLVFVWENMKAANQLDEKSPIGFFQSNIDLRGQALFTRDFALSTGGGWGETGEAGKKIGQALARTGQIGVEVTLTPQRDQRGRIVSLGAGEKPGLIVAQQGSDLLVQTAHGDAAAWPGLLVAGQPLHLVLNATEDGLELFAGGKSLGKKPGKFNPAEAAIDTLHFGDPAGGWHGILEGLAIYDRPLQGTEIAANSRLAEDRGKTRAAAVDRLG
ncbi:MAG TPA: hypothetical protein DDY32_01750, partial [Desulfobulbaceae bacterium]|nr:hypothetical protein [Desulfobulbaceae bacterium]